MYDAAQDPDADDSEAPDADAARLARQAAMLGELAELGMRMARAVTAQAIAAAEAGEMDGAAALAFGRAAKVVRQCVALENQLYEVRGETARGQAAAALTRDHEAVSRRFHRKLWFLYVKDKIRDAVEKVVRHNEVPREEAEQLLADLKHHLDDEAVVRELIEKDFASTVAYFCERYGLEVDWGLWDGQQWAEDHIRYLARNPPPPAPEPAEAGAGLEPAPP